MSPKIVDRDLRRREIAMAALEVFAEHGFEATSISQIAAAAGVGKGTIYLYFATKAELTVEAAHAWIEAVEQGVAPRVDTQRDPLDRLRTLIGASTRAFLEDPRMIRLFLGIAQVALDDSSPLGDLDLARKVSAPIREAVREILVDGAAQGILRPEVAREAGRHATNIVAFVDGLGLHHVSNPDAFDLDGQIDLYLETLIGSMRVAGEGGRDE